MIFPCFSSFIPLQFSPKQSLRIPPNQSSTVAEVKFTQCTIPHRTNPLQIAAVRCTTCSETSCLISCSELVESTEKSGLFRYLNLPNFFSEDPDCRVWFKRLDGGNDGGWATEGCDMDSAYYSPILYHQCFDWKRLLLLSVSSCYMLKTTTVGEESV